MRDTWITCGVCRASYATPTIQKPRIDSTNACESNADWNAWFAEPQKCWKWTKPRQSMQCYSTHEDSSICWTSCIWPWKSTCQCRDKHTKRCWGCITCNEHATIRSSRNSDGILYAKCIPTRGNPSCSIRLHGGIICTVWIHSKLQLCANTAGAPPKRSHQHWCAMGEARRSWFHKIMLQHCFVWRKQLEWL